MRAYEFRAWQKYHKKILDVISLKFKDKKITSVTVKYDNGVCPNIVTYDEFSKDFWLYDKDGNCCLVLEQFTGIYDNKRTEEYPNGQPIYEGDLVKSGYQENEEWIEAIATITWDDEYACFIQRINEKLEQCMDVICVVIGNIHESEDK